MKSGTSYWNISFIVHNLLTFALIIGLQHKLLDTITKTFKVVAEDLPQTLAVVEATAPLVESSQFNDFNTTRTTVDSSPSQPSSWSSSHISSSTALAERRAMQDKLLSPSLTSPVAYPVSTTATMSSSPNTKTTRIMSHTNSATPTQTISVLHTTFKTRSPSRISKGEYSGVSSKILVNKSVGMLQASISSYTPTPSIGIHKGDALTLLKNIKESKHNGKAGKINSSKSQSSGFYNNDQLEQKDSPHDFSFSKNYWTNTDAALSGGVDTTNSVAGSSGSVNFRLTSLSSVTSSSSSSVSAFSSSASSSSALSTTESERPRIFRNKHHHERHWGPFFEEPLNSTTSGDKSIIVAHLYTEAVLNCRVGMLKDKTVMWVRRTSEKVSLLTVGNVTYSSDPRIRVKFQYPNNWRLLINPTQWDDAGIYMCQVSTHPPRVFTTNLTVIEPPLRLIDDQERDVGDRYYKTGSTIDLQCQVSRSFLYKEKQNIVKSLKPLNIHNDSNATINSSSTFRAAASNSASSQSTDIKSKSADSRNLLSPSSSNNNNYNNNNNNKNETKIAANKNNNIYMSSAPDISGTSFFSTTSSATGFGILSNDLLQSINQSEIHANKQQFSVEQEFSNLVFWSKDDEALPPTALKRTSSNDKWFTSRVTITDAKLTDSGNYSCSIGRMFMVIVQVQVLTGELPAAVQHNSVATISIFSESIRGLIQLYWIYVIAAYFHIHE